MESDSTNRLPTHIAVIMDGNNRWARSRGLSGTAGHRRGAETARDLVDSCIKREVSYLTLFAFSSENWLRPKKEVNALMSLFLAVLKRKEIEQFHGKNVRIRFIGRRADFSTRLLNHMQQVEKLTEQNSGLTVTVAADYGGRWDITEAARKAAGEVMAGNLTAEQIDTDVIQRFISLGDAPAPDLCIRTGGEHRISNFLLWQFAYTELYFTDCYWPDFDDGQFQLALDDYASRQRRYGQHPDSG